MNDHFDLSDKALDRILAEQFWHHLELTELERYGDFLDKLSREAVIGFAREVLGRLLDTHNVLELAHEMIDSYEAEADERNRPTP